jgi:hypothetical protein
VARRGGRRWLSRSDLRPRGPAARHQRGRRGDTSIRVLDVAWRAGGFFWRVEACGPGASSPPSWRLRSPVKRAAIAVRHGHRRVVLRAEEPFARSMPDQYGWWRAQAIASEASGDRARLVDALARACHVDILMAAGEASCDKGLEVSRAAADAAGEAWTLAMRGNARLWTGRYEDGARDLQAALDRSPPVARARGLALLSRGGQVLEGGAFDRALESSTPRSRAARAAQDPETEGWAEIWRARVCAARCGGCRARSRVPAAAWRQRERIANSWRGRITWRAWRTSKSTTRSGTRPDRTRPRGIARHPGVVGGVAARGQPGRGVGRPRSAGRGRAAPAFPRAIAGRRNRAAARGGGCGWRPRGAQADRRGRR